MADMHGGYGETMDATDETQNICDQVRCRVEEKTKKKYVDFKAVEYRQWLNARYGLTLHFLIKVHVGEVNYIHLCVIQVHADEGRVELSDVQEQKSKDDPLVPFS